jgi:hypothetical protein
MTTDGQTGTTKLIVAFRNFARLKIKNVDRLQAGQLMNGGKTPDKRQEIFLSSTSPRPARGSPSLLPSGYG